MGCRKCRGWEDSECCLSERQQCSCSCHTSCDCFFCHTVGLKARSSLWQQQQQHKQQSKQQQSRQQESRQQQCLAASASTEAAVPPLQSAKSTSTMLTSVLRLESRASTLFDVADDQNQQHRRLGSLLGSPHQAAASADSALDKPRRWSRRSITLKPLRLFA
ncbi:hypothetical protein GQ54DRAFT_310558 [Martensiomyces pterosporus]|nr:hypothetical protein GQ54DRAFT_310558 [Martensiomyces pterosporus]